MRQIVLALGLMLVTAPVVAAQESMADLLDVSLAELMAEPVISASTIPEALAEAPATVIVISGEELTARGYRELSELYDDLPGMDLSRSYGDTFYRNQWRGLRKSIGTPYLLLLDGVLLNHLYYNQEEIIAALPMRLIERVEVVYGPASAVYGANAFVGVINVITRNRLPADGQQSSVQLRAGSFDTRIADLGWLGQQGEWRASVAARVHQGNLDPDAAQHYEWTRPDYLANRQLWGAFVDDPDRAGRYDSPYANLGLDARVFYRDTELAAQYFTLNTHFGNIYPGDRVQMRSYWSEPEHSFYLRQGWTFRRNLTGSTLLRYRDSGLAPDSDTLEAFVGTDPQTGQPARLMNYSYWGSENKSWTLAQSLDWRANPFTTVLGGLRWERKDLQKAYRINYGPTLRADQITDVSAYPNPPYASYDTIPSNRIQTEDLGGYLLWRQRLPGRPFGGGNHTLHLGLRQDHNSEYGSATSFRGGYVLAWERWTAKLLYGDGFNEPAPRELYGGWSGSGSNPSLDPETAHTLETSLAWTGERISWLVSAYELRSSDNITTFSGGATNLGDRHVYGADVHLKARQNWGDWRGDFWAYYSFTEARESRPQPSGVLLEDAVGDTARNKLKYGFTAVGPWLTGTLRGRYIGTRDTVPTNPAGKVDDYWLWDANLLLPVRGTGLQLELTVLNLTDRRYFHPGLREGNAGFAPGSFDAQGQWQGSAGYYNSLLPQDGRGVFVGLIWAL